MTHVIVVGDLMADVVATVTSPLAHASDTPAEIVRRPGGGGANVAARQAAAGVPTLLVARVGEDAASASPSTRSCSAGSSCSSSGLATTSAPSIPSSSRARSAAATSAGESSRHGAGWPESAR